MQFRRPRYLSLLSTMCQGDSGVSVASSIASRAREYAELLVAAGVDTVKELKTRNAANLAEKLAEVNAEKKLTRKVPSAKTVEGWVAQAAELPGMIEH